MWWKRASTRRRTATEAVERAHAQLTGRYVACQSGKTSATKTSNYQDRPDRAYMFPAIVCIRSLWYDRIIISATMSVCSLISRLLLHYHCQAPCHIRTTGGRWKVSIAAAANSGLFNDVSGGRQGRSDWRGGGISVYIPPPKKNQAKWTFYGVKWRENGYWTWVLSFIPPKKMYTPQNKYLATPLILSWKDKPRRDFQLVCHESNYSTWGAIIISQSNSAD